MESPEWQIETVAPDGEFKLEADGRTVMARHVPSVHGRAHAGCPYSGVAVACSWGEIALPAAGQPFRAPWDAWEPGSEGDAPDARLGGGMVNGGTRAERFDRRLLLRLRWLNEDPPREDE